MWKDEPSDSRCTFLKGFTSVSSGSFWVEFDIFILWGDVTKVVGNLVQRDEVTSNILVSMS